MDHLTITIGRDVNCTLVFDDPRMSSRHAQLEPLGGGRYRITDLGSRNGTFVDVDGRLRRIDREAEVTPAQRIRFGSCEATIGELLELAGVPAGAEPPPRPVAASPAPAAAVRPRLVRCAACGTIKPQGVTCPNPLCGQPTSGASR